MKLIDVSFADCYAYWLKNQPRPNFCLMTERFHKFFEDMKALGVVGWQGKWSNVDERWNRKHYEDDGDLMNPDEGHRKGEFPFRNYIFSQQPEVSDERQYVYISHEFKDEDVKAKVKAYVEASDFALWDGTYWNCICIFGGDKKDLPDHVLEKYDPELRERNKKKREDEAKAYEEACAAHKIKAAEIAKRREAGRIKAAKTREAAKLKKAAAAAKRAAAMAAKKLSKKVIKGGK